MVAQQTADLGEYRDAVEIALAGLQEEQVVERIWAGDHTVWGPERRPRLLATARRCWTLGGGLSVFTLTKTWSAVWAG